MVKEQKIRNPKNENKKKKKVDNKPNDEIEEIAVEKDKKFKGEEYKKQEKKMGLGKREQKEEKEGETRKEEEGRSETEEEIHASEKANVNRKDEKEKNTEVIEKQDEHIQEYKETKENEMDKQQEISRETDEEENSKERSSDEQEEQEEENEEENDEEEHSCYGNSCIAEEEKEEEKKNSNEKDEEDITSTHLSEQEEEDEESNEAEIKQKDSNNADVVWQEEEENDDEDEDENTATDIKEEAGKDDTIQREEEDTGIDAREGEGDEEEASDVDEERKENMDTGEEQERHDTDKEDEEENDAQQKQEENNKKKKKKKKKNKKSKLQQTTSPECGSILIGEKISNNVYLNNGGRLWGSDGAIEHVTTTDGGKRLLRKAIFCIDAEKLQLKSAVMFEKCRHSGKVYCCQRSLVDIFVYEPGDESKDWEEIKMVNITKNDLISDGITLEDTIEMDLIDEKKNAPCNKRRRNTNCICSRLKQLKSTNKTFDKKKNEEGLERRKMTRAAENSNESILLSHNLSVTKNGKGEMNAEIQENKRGKEERKEGEDEARDNLLNTEKKEKEREDDRTGKREDESEGEKKEERENEKKEEREDEKEQEIRHESKEKNEYEKKRAKPEKENEKKQEKENENKELKGDEKKEERGEASGDEAENDEGNEAEQEVSDDEKEGQNEQKEDKTERERKRKKQKKQNRKRNKYKAIFLDFLSFATFSCGSLSPFRFDTESGSGLNNKMRINETLPAKKKAVQKEDEVNKEDKKKIIKENEEEKELKDEKTKVEEGKKEEKGEEKEEKKGTNVFELENKQPLFSFRPVITAMKEKENCDKTMSKSNNEQKVNEKKEELEKKENTQKKEDIEKKKSAEEKQDTENKKIEKKVNADGKENIDEKKNLEKNKSAQEKESGQAHEKKEKNKSIEKQQNQPKIKNVENKENEEKNKKNNTCAKDEKKAKKESNDNQEEGKGKKDKEKENRQKLIKVEKKDASTKEGKEEEERKDDEEKKKETQKKVQEWEHNEQKDKKENNIKEENKNKVKSVKRENEEKKNSQEIKKEEPDYKYEQKDSNEHKEEKNETENECNKENEIQGNILQKAKFEKRAKEELKTITEKEEERKKEKRDDYDEKKMSQEKRTKKKEAKKLEEEIEVGKERQKEEKKENEEKKKQGKKEKKMEAVNEEEKKGAKKIKENKVENKAEGTTKEKEEKKVVDKKGDKTEKNSEEEPRLKDENNMKQEKERQQGKEQEEKKVRWEEDDRIKGENEKDGKTEEEKEKKEEKVSTEDKNKGMYVMSDDKEEEKKRAEERMIRVCREEEAEEENSDPFITVKKKKRKQKEKQVNNKERGRKKRVGSHTKEKHAKKQNSSSLSYKESIEKLCFSSSSLNSSNNNKSNKNNKSNNISSINNSSFYRRKASCVDIKINKNDFDSSAYNYTLKGNNSRVKNEDNANNKENVVNNNNHNSNAKNIINCDESNDDIRVSLAAYNPLDRSNVANSCITNEDTNCYEDYNSTTNTYDEGDYNKNYKSETESQNDNNSSALCLSDDGRLCTDSSVRTLEIVHTEEKLEMKETKEQVFEDVANTFVPKTLLEEISGIDNGDDRDEEKQETEKQTKFEEKMTNRNLNKFPFAKSPCACSSSIFSGFSALPYIRDSSVSTMQQQQDNNDECYDENGNDEGYTAEIDTFCKCSTENLPSFFQVEEDNYTCLVPPFDEEDVQANNPWRFNEPFALSSCSSFSSSSSCWSSSCLDNDDKKKETERQHKGAWGVSSDLAAGSLLFPLSSCQSSGFSPFSSSSSFSSSCSSSPFSSSSSSSSSSSYFSCFSHCNKDPLLSRSSNAVLSPILLGSSDNLSTPPLSARSSPRACDIRFLPSLHTNDGNKFLVPSSVSSSDSSFSSSSCHSASLPFSSSASFPLFSCMSGDTANKIVEPQNQVNRSASVFLGEEDVDCSFLVSVQSNEDECASLQPDKQEKFFVRGGNRRENNVDNNSYNDNNNRLTCLNNNNCDLPLQNKKNTNDLSSYAGNNVKTANIDKCNLYYDKNTHAGNNCKNSNIYIKCNDICNNPHTNTNAHFKTDNKKAFNTRDQSTFFDYKKKKYDGGYSNDSKNISYNVFFSPQNNTKFQTCETIQGENQGRKQHLIKEKKRKKKEIGSDFKGKSDGFFSHYAKESGRSPVKPELLIDSHKCLKKNMQNNDSTTRDVHIAKFKSKGDRVSPVQLPIAGNGKTHSSQKAASAPSLSSSSPSLLSSFSSSSSLSLLPSIAPHYNTPPSLGTPILPQETQYSLPPVRSNVNVKEHANKDANSGGSFNLFPLPSLSSSHVYNSQENKNTGYSSLRCQSSILPVQSSVAFLTQYDCPSGEPHNSILHESFLRNHMSDVSSGFPSCSSAEAFSSSSKSCLQNKHPGPTSAKHIPPQQENLHRRFTAEHGISKLPSSHQGTHSPHSLPVIPIPPPHPYYSSAPAFNVMQKQWNESMHINKENISVHINKENVSEHKQNTKNKKHTTQLSLVSQSEAVRSCTLSQEQKALQPSPPPASIPTQLSPQSPMSTMIEQKVTHLQEKPPQPLHLSKLNKLMVKPQEQVNQNIDIDDSSFTEKLFSGTLAQSIDMSYILKPEETITTTQHGPAVSPHQNEYPYSNLHYVAMTATTDQHKEAHILQRQVCMPKEIPLEGYDVIMIRRKPLQQQGMQRKYDMQQERSAIILPSTVQCDEPYTSHSIHHEQLRGQHGVCTPPWLQTSHAML